MAVLTTTGSVGNREDLIPIITMISPSDTPLLSSIAAKKSTGTKHEWLTDALGTPVLNAVAEGSAANPTAANLATRVRVSNTIQNIRKVGSVSDNQEAVLKAGVKSEYSYQLEKATKGVALDTERSLIQGSEGAAGVPTMAGLFSFTQTNQIGAQALPVITGLAVAGAATTITLAAGHGAVVGDYILICQKVIGGLKSVAQGQYRRITALAVNVATVLAWDITPAVGDQYKVFKATVLNSVRLNDTFEASYIQGGSPDCVMAHPTQKRAISGLDAANRRLSSTEKKVSNAIDMYESDFGTHAVKTNRWMPTGSIAILEKSQFAAAYLRPAKAEQLARVGSSRDFMIESAVTLEARAENSSALILGLA